MEKVEFTIKVRGYDKNEVDEYIDKLRNEFAEVCTHLQEKVKSMEETLGKQEDIVQVMLRAQSEVRNMRDAAAAEVNRMMEEAAREADRIIGEARTKAGGIEAVTEVEAGRVMRRANQYYSDIRDKIQQAFNISSMFLAEMNEIDSVPDAAAAAGEKPGNEETALELIMQAALAS